MHSCYSVITHTDSSRVSIAIIRVCDSMCMRFCLSVLTIKPKWLKLKLPNSAQG